jgi:hypothetical protein
VPCNAAQQPHRISLLVSFGTGSGWGSRGAIGRQCGRTRSRYGVKMPPAIGRELVVVRRPKIAKLEPLVVVPPVTPRSEASADRTASVIRDFGCLAHRHLDRSVSRAVILPEPAALFQDPSSCGRAPWGGTRDAVWGWFRGYEAWMLGEIPVEGRVFAGFPVSGKGPTIN